MYSEIYDVYGEENIEKFSKNLISLNRKMAETDLNLYKKNIEKMKELEMASLKNEYENNPEKDHRTNALPSREPRSIQRFLR